jgi:hypothetical protein
LPIVISVSTSFSCAPGAVMGWDIRWQSPYSCGRS